MVISFAHWGCSAIADYCIFDVFNGRLWSLLGSSLRFSQLWSRSSWARHLLSAAALPTEGTGDKPEPSVFKNPADVTFALGFTNMKLIWKQLPLWKKKIPQNTSLLSDFLICWKKTFGLCGSLTLLAFLPVSQQGQMWPLKQRWCSKEEVISGWSLAFHPEGDPTLISLWLRTQPWGYKQKRTHTRMSKDFLSISLQLSMMVAASPACLVTPNSHTRRKESQHYPLFVSVSHE